MTTLASSPVDPLDEPPVAMRAAEKTVLRLGFWSAAITASMSALFFIPLLAGDLNWMYLSSFLLAPAFVAMVVGIHCAASHAKKVWSQLGLMYAAIYAVMCSLTYYVQLTVINNNPLQFSPEMLQPFVFVPGTPMFAQDMLGYVFMCAATLSAGFVFENGRLEKWIRWLFIANGIFILPVLILPALPLPVDEAGTGLGDRIGTYANVAWSAYFTLAAGLVAVRFRRLLRKQVLTPGG